MKKIMVLLVSLLFVCSCSNSEEKDYKELMKENDYIILDVRTEEEYNEAHIKDALNLPYDKIDESLLLDKNNLIFVYCKSGGRSKIAYDTLKELGYNVYDLGSIDNIDLPIE